MCTSQMTIYLVDHLRLFWIASDLGGSHGDPSVAPLFYSGQVGRRMVDYNAYVLIRPIQITILITSTPFASTRTYMPPTRLLTLMSSRDRRTKSAWTAIVI